MTEKKSFLINYIKNPPKISKYAIILSSLIVASISVRLYYFPFDVPLSADALYYFWYSSDTFQNGNLPTDWTPTNNGWPIFVSFFFSMLDSNDIFTLMNMQRMLSVLISTFISIPVYFLCKKFVAAKFAVVGAALVAFDPRLMINSFLGVTDPLYLLLFATSLTLFLSNNKKFMYVSFTLASFSMLIRGEGIVIFVLLSILFFVKFRHKKREYLNYLLIIGIFSLIVFPLTFYRLDVIGTDPVFVRSISSGTDVLSDVSTSQNLLDNRILDGLGLLIRYLVWISIPNFIIFLPLGFFIILKHSNFEKKVIVFSVGMMILPAFYAYTIPALDTRYLYTLFPMFAVISALSVEKISHRINQQNMFVILVIFMIFLTSLFFYEYKKVDYETEKEIYDALHDINPSINGVNSLPGVSSYFGSIQTIDEWPSLNVQSNLDVMVISTLNYDNLESFIMDYESKELTHIMIDDKNNRPDFLRSVFFNESDYPYLHKIYDSTESSYRLKIFEIDYELFSKSMTLQ